MTVQFLKNAMSISLLVVLVACGGEDQPPAHAPGSATPAPTPSATPSGAPSTTPSPSPSPLSGPIAIERVGDFTVLGYEKNYDTRFDGSDPRNLTETFEGTKFRYLAGGIHELLLPHFEWTTLGRATRFADSSFSRQRVKEPNGGKDFELLMLIPGTRELPLSYTGFATWYGASSLPNDRIFQYSGGFAYGIATSMDQLPTSGSVTYRGFGDLDGYGTTSPIEITADFATRRITGKITPTFTEFGGWARAVGTYEFDGAVDAGAATATLAVTLANGKTGTLEIAFTGEVGEELMFRFRGTVPCVFINGGDCTVVFPGAAVKD